jgi:hypothetical protein
MSAIVVEEPPAAVPAAREEKHFRVVDAVVTSPIVCSVASLGGKTGEIGRYGGKTPYQAAKKAATKLQARFKAGGVDANHYYFAIREQTRNAPRLLRIYSATRLKRDRPHVWPKKKKTEAGGDGSGANEEVEEHMNEYKTQIRAVLEPEKVAEVLRVFEQASAPDLQQQK